jgi:SAM-dependent methyltransferase
VTDSTALPFAEASLDLVVLPHTLEFSADPHASLREVQRVLVPEGRVAITGLNPASLWGLRQYRARWLGGRLFLPDVGEFIGPRRLRDWLQLLELELESADFGCYQPAVRGARTLARFGWLERLGQRWWPILGATYCIVAVKRVRGPLLIGQSWRKAAAPVGQPASLPGARRRRAITRKVILDRVEMYTDGACKGNPGPGGWGHGCARRATRKSCTAASR